jgi:hypothetical protein
MSKPTLKFVNAETGEETEREMTDAEFKQWEADKNAALAKAQAEEDAVIVKAALLVKLGITADEAKLLLA